LREHHPPGCLRHDPHSVQIDGQDGVPIGERELLGAMATLDGRVVHDDVQAAQRQQGGVDQRQSVMTLRQIGLQWQRPHLGGGGE